MKKILLTSLLAIGCMVNSWAYDSSSLTSYLAYANRLWSANSAVAASETLREAAEAAEGSLGTADEATALATLKAAVQSFVSAGVASNGSVYVEYNGSMGSVGTWIEAGWDLGYVGTGSGNTWYTQNRTEFGGYALSKWNSNTLETFDNYAKQTLYDLPIGSYTINIMAGATAGKVVAFYTLNGADEVTMPIDNGEAEVLSFSFYANSAVTSLQYGVKDLEGMHDWISFGNVNVVFAGEDVLAPNKAAFLAAYEAAELTAAANLVVPEGVIGSLHGVINQYNGASYATAAEYDEATVALNLAVTEARNSVSTYADFLSTVTLVGTLLSSAPNSDEKTILQEVLVAQQAIVNEATSNAVILRALTVLEEAYRDYQYNVADETNPVVLFESGEISSLNGWVTGPTATGNTGGSKWFVRNRTSAPTGYFMEMWGTAASNYAYRQMANVPEGLYSLSMYVANSSDCEMVFGDERVELPAHDPGFVRQQDFYLESPVDLLQFGLYSDDGNWVAMNHVTLVYKGKDAVLVMRNEALRKIKEAEQYFEQYNGILSELILGNFQDNLMDAEDAANAATTVEEVKQVEEDLAAAIEALSLCKTASEAYIVMAEKANKLADLADEQELDEVITAQTAAFEEALTAADIEACIEALKAVVDKYGLQYASEDNPFELFNSGEISSLEEWVTGGSGESNGNNNWYIANRTEAPLGDVLTMWGTTKSNYAYLEFADLPAGAYRISVNVGASAPISLYFNGSLDTQLIATGDGAVFSALFVLAAEQAVTQVGVQAPATWVAFNDLTIEYLGNEGTLTIAKGQLEDAIMTAQAVVDAGEMVGSGLFYINTAAPATYQEAIDAATRVLSSATTLEEVGNAITALNEARVAYEGSVNIPEPTAVYVIKQTVSDLYINLNPETGAVTVSETAVGINFVPDGAGAYFIGSGDAYALGYMGTNTWTMSAAGATKSGWAVMIADGAYELKSTNGFLASDNIDEGSALYGNKATGHANGQWLIEVAPEEIANAIEEVEAEEQEFGAVYNLAGQRVDESYRGIVIKHGKKYLRR